jgi:hypothetical protein
MICLSDGGEQMSIEEYIPFGRENAVTRQVLCALTGLSDRKVRKLIEDARREGCIICNDQDGAGYYQTADLDEIESQYRQQRSRALSILSQQKHMRRLLKAAGREV